MQVYSVYETIDGEVNAWDGIGQLSLFVRLYGCNLRCNYCDSRRAVDGGNFETISVGGLIDRIKRRNPNKITITGGEPFLQPAGMRRLVEELIAWKPWVKITIETNGITAFPEFFYEWGDNVRLVMDCKLPSSGMRAGDADLLWKLRPVDVLKFVLNDTIDADDFEVMKAAIELYINRHETASVPAPKLAFSPVLPTYCQPIEDERVTKDRVKGAFKVLKVKVFPMLNKGTFRSVIFSCQLHKLLRFEEDNA